jgi:2-iminobutanoate/2-iminopropanoate deaminase
MKTIVVPDAVQPHGHYVHAVEHAGTLYVSGILGNSTSGAPLAARDLQQQLEHCFEQLERILQAGGSGLDQVAKLTVYVTSVEHWPAVNQFCAARFGSHRPARTIAPCGQLRLESLIELDVIAACRP